MLQPWLPAYAIALTLLSKLNTNDNHKSVAKLYDFKGSDSDKTLYWQLIFEESKWKPFQSRLSLLGLTV